MAINQNYICVLDYETGSASCYDPIPLELAAVIVDPRTLKRVPGAEFSTLIKPHCGWSGVQAKALEVNKIDPDEVNAKGLDEKLAFEQFCKFVKQYARSSNKWTNPIIAGHNINGFDRIITDQLCFKYKYVDKDGYPKLLHPRDSFDTQTIIMSWFENEPEPEKYSLDYLREWFGISGEGAHRALKDVEDCADILCRFLHFQRKLSANHRPKFKGCFAK